MNIFIHKMDKAVVKSKGIRLTVISLHIHSRLHLPRWISIQTDTASME